LALVAVLLLAAVLRLYGIDWGLPSAQHPDYSYHPDEMPTMIWARWLAAGHIITKHFIWGGTLYFSILNGYWYCGTFFGSVLQGSNALADAILFGRYFLVGISLLTMFLLYQTGRLLFDRRVGLLAAFLLAISPAHILWAQQVRPDQIAALLSVLITYLAALILRSDGTRDRKLFLFAGLALGLTIALRFPLGIFGLVPVAAYVWRDGSVGIRAVLTKLVDRNIWIMVAAMSGIFVAASPHSLLYFDVLLAGLRLTWHYETIVFPDAMDMGPGIYQYGWLMLRQALGLPMYGLVLAAMVLALYQRTSAQRLVLVAVIPYFILTTFASWVVVRYTLPIVPLLLLLAAAGVVFLQRSLWRWRHAVTVVLSTAVVWTLMGDLAFLRVEAHTNVRELASEWIRTRIPPGASIVTVESYRGDVFFNPVIPDGYRHYILELVPGSSPQELADRDYDYLVLSEAVYKNMERLGDRHPSAETVALQRTLQGAGYRLLQEIKQPITFLGVDFQTSYTALDFTVINPGIRIYRHER
jgi:4-amino-4-deoxy-L-arabinose transferase-like glycosyltransferase